MLVRMRISSNVSPITEITAPKSNPLQKPVRHGCLNTCTRHDGISTLAFLFSSPRSASASASKATCDQVGSTRVCVLAGDVGGCASAPSWPTPYRAMRDLWAGVGSRPLVTSLPPLFFAFIARTFLCCSICVYVCLSACVCVCVRICACVKSAVCQHFCESMCRCVRVSVCPHVLLFKFSHVLTLACFNPTLHPFLVFSTPTI